MIAITPKQAEAVLAQLDSEQAMEDALNSFIKEGGAAVGPYLDGNTGYANGKIVAVWGLEHLGRHALTLVSGWEIAFANTRARLVADPAWRNKAAIYRDLEARLTAQQFKQLSLGETPILSGELVADLQKLGGVVAFQKFANGEVQ